MSHDPRRRSRAPLGLLAIAATILTLALGEPSGLLTLFGLHTLTRDVDVPEPERERRDIVRAPRSEPTATQEGATSEAAADAGRWGARAERPSTSGSRIEELRGGWRVEAGAEEAAALGVIAAHAWAHAQGAGQQGDMGQGGMGRTIGAARTAPAVTLEAVERPGPAHAVVTVLVAHGDSVQRIAVPIVFHATGPALAGGPWRLPSPSTVPVALEGGAVEDEQLLDAARDALDRVGIPGSRLARLEATEGWPFIARLEDDTLGHPWLRWHLDRFVVTGLPLDRAADGT